MSVEALLSSGNLQADRRFDYARDLWARGECDSAIDLLQQALEMVPNWAAGWFRLGEMQMELGAQDGAIETFTHYLRLEPEDVMGAQIKLTLLGAMDGMPDTLPNAYVETLFDDYADHFDQALVEQLNYQAPQQIAALIDAVRYEQGKADFKERVLDLGCGTGLSGEAIFHRSAVLDGVDLSSGMINEARNKDIYNQLFVSDIETYLSSSEVPYDVILAADVFVYLGNLERILSLVAGHLATGGLFAFSIQEYDGLGYNLGEDHRFSHSMDYIQSCLDKANLITVQYKQVVLRQDAGRDMIGYVIVVEKDKKNQNFEESLLLGTRRKPRILQRY